MLYPKEDKENKMLLYACRNCQYQEVADNTCIYVNRITAEVDEFTQIIGDVIADPTLPRTEDHPCPKCGHRQAVFFQSHSTKAEEGMKLYYVCTNQQCVHKWTEWSRYFCFETALPLLLSTILWISSLDVIVRSEFILDHCDESIVHWWSGLFFSDSYLFTEIMDTFGPKVLVYIKKEAAAEESRLFLFLFLYIWTINIQSKNFCLNLFYSV